MATNNEATSLVGSGSKETKKSKTARCYYCFMLVVFLVLFLDSVISLGIFGAIQAKVNNLRTSNNTCILFGTLATSTEDSVVCIDLPNVGSCAFVLWGLVSVTIVAFVWLIYFIVLFVLNTIVRSPLRILDFLVFLLTCLLSFSLSVTITAGVRKTCSALQLGTSCTYGTIYRDCNHTTGPDDMFHFYGKVNSSQTASWVATVILVFVAVCKFISVVAYCKRRRKLRLNSNQDEVVSPDASD